MSKLTSLASMGSMGMGIGKKISSIVDWSAWDGRFTTTVTETPPGNDSIEIVQFGANGPPGGTTVDYTVSGTLSGNDDFFSGALIAFPGTLTVLDDQGIGPYIFLAFTIKEDNLLEGTETLSLTLAATDSAGNPTGSPTLTYTIEDTSSGTFLYDFTLGTAPSGIIEKTTVAPAFNWSGGYLNFDAIARDPNNVESYPIRVDNVFTGDYLIQLSHSLDDLSTNDCSDAGIGLFNTSPLNTWNWIWGQSAGRIAAQNNCNTPTIYGQSSQTQDSSALGSRNGWVTLHLFHRPSINQTNYRITEAYEDWSVTGSVISNITLSESWSSNYYVGISGDSDDYITKHSAMRISPL